MGRGGRRTVGDNRERLAKIKRAAVDRVLEELSTDPEKAGLVMTRDELLDRLSESYAQGLRHAKALDPNKARYVRESMVECAKARQPSPAGGLKGVVTQRKVWDNGFG